MTAAQFEFYDFVMIPLGPIHVGGGEEARLLPEDYRLHDGYAERVSLRRILARLPMDQRDRLLRDIEQNPDGFIRNLQQQALPDDVVERVLISVDSQQAVDLAGEGRGRKNQVDAFFRSGGMPTLPGSSFKGAIRTAWLYAMWKYKEKQLGKRPFEGRAARDLEASLFDLANGKLATDTDPMRDVMVLDAILPAQATRIDKVYRRKASHEGNAIDATGEIHRERLRGVVDGGEPPIIDIRIGLRSKAIIQLRKKLENSGHPTPKHAPTEISWLLSALEMHHEPLWAREQSRFFAHDDCASLRRALELFSAFTRGGRTPAAALIRLGWAGHAEAKSLEPVRRIQRPQFKGNERIASEGSTRHVLSVGGSPTPFGWALLIRREEWEKSRITDWLAPVPDRRAEGVQRDERSRGDQQRQGPADRRETALGRGVLYSAGTRVLLADGEEAVLAEDVTNAHRPEETVMADIEGDREPLRIDEIKGRA